MSTEVKYLLPESLTGPRAYFTDLDPRDPGYSEGDTLRKLKLQLLLKQTVVVAASSLFHDVGHRLFVKHPDLIPALERGVIAPALRDQFMTPDAFFRSKPEYSLASRRFFLTHAKVVVPWSLSEASGWFKRRLLDALRNPESVLRKGGAFTENEARQVAESIEDAIAQEPAGSQFLQRRHIQKAASRLDSTKGDFLENYGHLLYRLLGAYVVRSEGHFPQSNLTKLHLSADDAKLAEETIFWDLYVEAVLSALNSAVRLTPERLDRLTFKDILAIRGQLFDTGFSDQYDELIAAIKGDIAISDPDRILLRLNEVNEAAKNLREEFRTRVFSEIPVRDSSAGENALWQVVNVLALLSSPVISLVVGLLSAVKALPEITALTSPRLSRSIADRREWVRQFVNSRVGWTHSQRATFLEAYDTLATYGLPTRRR